MEWEKEPVTGEENPVTEETAAEATTAEMAGEIEVCMETEPEGQPECDKAEDPECQEEADEPAEMGAPEEPCCGEPAEASAPEEPCCGESTEAAEPEADPVEIDPDSDASVPRE